MTGSFVTAAPCHYALSHYVGCYQSINVNLRIKYIYSLTAVLRSNRPDTSNLPPTPASVAPESTLVLPYSSGTTGLPKGVVLSHTNLAANVAQCMAHPTVNMGISQDDVVLGVLPFYHIYGMVAVLHTTLWCGATIVTMPAFDPEGFLGAVQEHKVSYLPVAPPLVRLCLCPALPAHVHTCTDACVRTLTCARMRSLYILLIFKCVCLGAGCCLALGR